MDVAVPVSGETAVITFSADAGQWVSLATSNSTLATSDSCPGVELLNPDGSWAGSLYACDPSDVMYATQLTQSGTYAIFVDGQGATGSIDIQLYDATPVSGTISIDGPPVAASMSAPSQNFEYTFSGTAGQQVGLSATNFSSYFPSYDDCSPDVQILDPNGNYIDEASFYLFDWPNGPPDGTATLWNGNDVLASDGAYSILVDNSGCMSGSLQIALFTSNTQGGTISLNGATATATSSVPGQPTQLTIGAGTGQSVYLNTSNSTYQDEVEVELIDPNGLFVDLLGQCGASGTMGPDTLSINGTYTLSVVPQGAPGSIDLSLSSQSSGAASGGCGDGGGGVD